MSRRVAFTHNYPMQLSRARVQEGRYPAQHLYGADHLERAGWTVEYVPWASPHLASWLSARTGLRWGELAQERRILARLRHLDVVYAGEPHHVAGLARLRGRGLLRTPLVGVVHQVPRPRDRGWVRGLDLPLCLSRRVAEAVDELRRGLPPARTIPWGPDLQFPGYADAGTAEFVVSAGKSNRDLTTLLAALAHVPARARVYAVTQETGPVPPQVEVVTTTEHLDEGGVGPPQFAYEQVLADLQRASVVAVPLLDPDCLSGLTEVADALALGKPIVMTRTPFLDLDIEAAGCGVWVDKGDVRGWTAALSAIVTDHERRASMGRRARAVAEDGWNATTFGEGVSRALDDALAGRRP